MDRKTENKISNSTLGFIMGILFGSIAIHSFIRGDINQALLIVAFGVGIIALIIIDAYVQQNRLLVIEALKRLGLLPKPTEAGMFVMALTALILMFSSGDLWDEALWLMSEDGRYGLVIIYIAIGGVLSIYHAFSQRKKSDFEKRIMKYFSAITLVAIAVSTAVFVYESKQPAFLVFTIWNSIQAGVLMLFSGREYVGEFVHLPKRNAKLLEIVLGSVIVVVVFGIERLVFDTHWSIAVSSVLIVWLIAETFFERSRWVQNSAILGNKFR